jgi:hypothetical protein
MHAEYQGIGMVHAEAYVLSLPWIPHHLLTWVPMDTLRFILTMTYGTLVCS